MITYKLISHMSNDEITQCNKLINSSFKTNRFSDYKYAIFYKIDKEIIGFVGIYDNLLNQLCTNLNYRKQGIATKILNECKKLLTLPIYLYIDKLKNNTEYLLNYYIKQSFKIDIENDVEYRMIYQ